MNCFPAGTIPPDRGMIPASIINFLSNEDTPPQSSDRRSDEPSVQWSIAVREEKVLRTFFILYWEPYLAITGVIIEPPQRLPCVSGFLGIRPPSNKAGTCKRQIPASSVKTRNQTRYFPPWKKPEAKPL
jgi:hypothetical protein